MTSTIVRSSLILSLLIAFRMMQIIIPDLPNGLGDITSLLEIVIIISAISVGFKETFLATLIYIACVAWIEPPLFIAGILWVRNIENVAGVYFLDYFLPLLLLSFIGIFDFKRKFAWSTVIALTIIANYLLHSMAGVVFWGSWAWSGWGVYTYSFSANAIKSGALLIILMALVPVMLSLRKKIHGFHRNGYLNIVEKKDGYFIKKQKSAMPENMKSEAAIYKKLGMDFEIIGNTIKRKWIDGNTVDEWTPKLLTELRTCIADFQKLDISDLTENNYYKYDEYSDKISAISFNRLKQLREKYKREQLVVSHNDINKQNVLVSNGNLTLIDFEWANLNFKYFDYIQFEITEGIKLESFENEKYDELMELILVFFVLWTYSVPISKFVKSRRNDYVNILEKKYSHKCIIKTR